MAFRSCISAALVLVLVLTGQSMAIARTAPGPSGSIVLCTGTGPVTVLVDESGAPMGGVHICPDCVMGLFDTPLPGAIDLPRHLSHPCAISAATERVLLQEDGLFFSRARAPPAQD